MGLNDILQPNDSVEETFLFDIADMVFKKYNLFQDMDADEYYMYCIALGNDIKAIIDLLM